MTQRFSFPAGCPVVLDNPGVYQIVKLDDDSLLVERIDRPDTTEAVDGDGLETISEIMEGHHGIQQNS